MESKTEKKREARHTQRSRETNTVTISIPSVLQSDAGCHYPLGNDGVDTNCSSGSDGRSRKCC